MRSNKGINIFLLIVGLILFMLISKTFGIKERENKKGLEALEFVDERLYISQQQIPIDKVLDELVNGENWKKYMRDKEGWQIYIDPRSGRPVSVLCVVPLIPGDGEGNNIKLEDISNRVGYEVKEINEDVIKDLLIGYIKEHSDLLMVDVKER